jgi:hypothetical protein
VSRKRVVDHANHILEYLREVAHERGLHVFSDPREVVYVDDWGNVHVWIANSKEDGTPKREIAEFRLQQMPGCCAILTMSYVHTNPKYMTFAGAVELVCEAAKRAAFGSVCLTQVVNRERAEKCEWFSIVSYGSFKMSQWFINAKSGNRVVYLTRNLGQVGQMEGFEEEVRG